MKGTIQPSRQNWVTRIVLNLLGTATMKVESLKLGTAGLRSGMTMNADKVCMLARGSAAQVGKTIPYKCVGCKKRL